MTGLAIQDGAAACETWNRIVSGRFDAATKAKRVSDLLVYCGQDTRAMFEIWNVLFSVSAAAQRAEGTTVLDKPMEPTEHGQLQTRPLRRAKSESELKLYRAALEWDLTDPIVIERPQGPEVGEALAGAQLTPYNHQVTNLITFCRRLPVTLIADDVGSARPSAPDLVASELIARARVSKILIVCPKLLMPQWQEELQTKFGIAAEIATGREADRG